MKSVLSLLESACEPDQIVARDSRTALTAAELADRVRQTIHFLQANGIDSLALHADNSTDWVIVDLACQAADICLLPLPTFFSRAQLEHALDIAGVNAIACENPDCFAGIERFGPACQRQALGRYQLLRSDHSVAGVRLPPGTRKITFTSGSTGTPKGVCLGTSQLMAQANALQQAVGLSKPRHLCLLPLSTLLENVAGVYAPLLAGGEVLLPGLSEVGFEGSSSLDPVAFTRCISVHAPETMILTPQLLLVLLAAVAQGWQVPPSLKFVAVGGGTVSPVLVERAHANGLPVYEGYGLSECASVVSLNTPRANDPGSSGKPLPHLRVTIEDGEIVIGGNSMLGYAGEPESWGLERIHSGDLGAFNEQGFLQVSGRRKNVLISSFGRNINPEWVESELLARPALAECLVLGDQRPYCIALVRPLSPSANDDSIQQHIDAVNHTLPDYARVQRWHRLDQPLAATANLVTDNGRPRRRAIESHFEPLLESLYRENPRTSCL